MVQKTINGERKLKKIKLRYQMCPECYVVFSPLELDKLIYVGNHLDGCSKPKAQTYTEDRDEVIRKVKQGSDFRTRYKDDV